MKVPLKLIAIWLLALMLGTVLMARYEGRPGTVGQLAPRWSSASGPDLAFDQDNLLVFVHPHCACTRATMAELERLQTTAHRPLHLHVIFYKPEDQPDAWVETEYWQTAQHLGAERRIDAGGRWAARLGAQTSGFTLLYDRHQQLVYAGGITPSRGHTGDSDGRDALLQALNAESSEPRKGLVFGCTLLKRSTERKL